MSGTVHDVRLRRRAPRLLPRGWRDFLLQMGIFAAFDLTYELTHGLASGSRPIALRHAHSVVRAERALGFYRELAIQRWAERAPGVVLDVANWTYLNCQFTVTIIFLLWVYSQRNDSYYFIRNVIIAADFLAVFGYIGYPTAPPRMLTTFGFQDTLDQTSVNLHSPIISALTNPYAAMPSLHSATALLVGTSGVLLVRRTWAKVLWSFYPALVVFSIVATGNHFILDAIFGAVDLLAALTLALGLAYARRRRAAAAAHDWRPSRAAALARAGDAG